MMKKLVLIFLAFSSISIYANCESVDAVLAKYKYGLTGALELSEVIDCQLRESTPPKTLCNSKIGLKRDQLEVKIKMFEFGMLTKAELDKANNELTEVEEQCK